MDGSLFEQKVCYDWVPPFCQTCNRVGHVCESQERKVVKKWVVKSKPQEACVWEEKVSGEVVTPIMIHVPVHKNKWHQVSTKKVGKAPQRIPSNRLRLSTSMVSKLVEISEGEFVGTEHGGGEGCEDDDGQPVSLLDT